MKAGWVLVVGEESTVERFVASAAESARASGLTAFSEVKRRDVANLPAWIPAPVVMGAELVPL